MRSASALLVMSNGSKPSSSSCCLVDEPKPKAACQSVEDETGMVSAKGKQHYLLKHNSSQVELITFMPSF